MRRTIFNVLPLLFFSFLSFSLCPQVSAQDTSITFVSSLKIGAQGLDGDGRYIYVVLDAMRVVDYSDPDYPSVIGELAHSADDIDVEGNYAHTIRLFSSTLVIDVSDPENPALAAYYPYNGYTHAAGANIHVYDTLAFINGCPSGIPEDWPLVCYNISDPADPKLLSSYYPEGWYVYWNMCKAGDLVYQVRVWADARDYAFYIIDYGDPSNPLLMGQANGLEEQLLSVAVKGNYAYVSRYGLGVADRYLYILDISNPQDPYLLGNFDTTGFDPFQITVKGNHAFVAGLNSGVHILDVSDPVQPRRIASYPTWARDIHVEGQLIFVASNDSLVILRASFLPAGPGDVDNNGTVSVTDVVYLINYLFRSGPEPYWLNSADVNGDGEANIIDVVYLINYLFKGGPPPQKGGSRQ